MKAFIFACLAIAVVAVGANLALERAGWSSAERTTQAASVRLD